MRWRVLLLALLVLAGPAWAELPAQCRVAAHLAETSFPLPKVTRALAEKKLNILVVGAGSSQLPGANGEKNAYPARLQQALSDQLPGVEVKVATDIKASRTAAEMVKVLPADLSATKPALLVWQTGTTDAMRAVDPDQFSQALDQGINIARGGRRGRGSGKRAIQPANRIDDRLEHLFRRHALGCIAARSAAFRPIQHYAAVVGPRNVRFILCHEKT